MINDIEDWILFGHICDYDTLNYVPYAICYSSIFNNCNNKYL